MVPLVCGECALNFCLRHRHASDHACDGKLAAKKRAAAYVLNYIIDTGSAYIRPDELDL